MAAALAAAGAGPAPAPAAAPAAAVPRSNIGPIDQSLDNNACDVDDNAPLVWPDGLDPEIDIKSNYVRANPALLLPASPARVWPAMASFISTGGYVGPRVPPPAVPGPFDLDLQHININGMPGYVPGAVNPNAMQLSRYHPSRSASGSDERIRNTNDQRHIGLMVHAFYTCSGDNTNLAARVNYFLHRCEPWYALAQFINCIEARERHQDEYRPNGRNYQDAQPAQPAQLAQPARRGRPAQPAQPAQPATPASDHTPQFNTHATEVRGVYIGLARLLSVLDQRGAHPADVRVTYGAQGFACNVDQTLRTANRLVAIGRAKAVAEAWATAWRNTNPGASNTQKRAAAHAAADQIRNSRLIDGPGMKGIYREAIIPPANPGGRRRTRRKNGRRRTQKKRNTYV